MPVTQAGARRKRWCGGTLPANPNETGAGMNYEVSLQVAAACRVLVGFGPQPPVPGAAECGATSRPRRAASWSITGARAATGCGGPNGRRSGGMSASLLRVKASSCSARLSGTVAGCPVARARSQPSPQELGDAQVKGDDARNRAEWDGDNPVEGTRLAERAEQCGGRVAIGVQQASLRMTGTWGLPVVGPPGGRPRTGCSRRQRG